MTRERSEALAIRARDVMVGGVNSPVRAFKAVGGEPLFFARAEGPRMWDADGNEYLDYIGSWGPMILGHSHPAVVQAVVDAAGRGFSFGACAEGEVLLAEKVREFVPSMERVRMVNSGTEATMSALRAARGFTGRSKIVKFAGNYHGHADGLLVKAGSGALTFGVPDSAGVPAEVARATLTASYNDLGSVREVIAAAEGDVAAVILEPVAGNMGVVPPAEEFLEGLRALCDADEIVLILDEVMSGFRVARGGAQARYDVRPDLSCFGKVIGGGFPVGCYGGRAEIMDCVSPSGPVYQAGTLSGNPVAMAAGLATLEQLDEALYETLEQRSAALEDGLRAAARDAGVTATTNRVGSMVTLFFQEGPVVDYESAVNSDTERFGAWWRGMRDRGVFLPPSQFEALFVSGSHTADDIEATVQAGREVLGTL
jgi:glutamate-1-semialdehyde 2,1-aminomutase